jgi:hypothetical protein
MMRNHAAAILRVIRAQIDMLAESAEAGEIGLAERYGQTIARRATRSASNLAKHI